MVKKRYIKPNPRKGMKIRIKGGKAIDSATRLMKEVELISKRRRK